MTTHFPNFSTRKGHPAASQRPFCSPARERGAVGWGLVAVAAITLLAGCAREPDVTLFEDVTDKSGLGDYLGMTYGAAWGDYNGDGLPDLYVTNHLNEARLYRNTGDDRFADESREVFAAEEQRWLARPGTVDGCCARAWLRTEALVSQPGCEIRGCGRGGRCCQRSWPHAHAAVVRS